MNTSRVWRLVSYVWYPTIFLLCAITAFSSCEKDCVDGTIDPHPVYFQYEILNYAWGHFHAGWYIDDEGNFNYYNLPQNWNEPDSNGYISEAALLSNFEKADSIIYHVSVESLQNQIAIIDDVDADKYSEVQFLAADAGKMEFYCFKWDKNRSAYQRISLAYTGDFAQHNLDPEAKGLTAWLIAEGEQSGFFAWW